MVARGGGVEWASVFPRPLRIEGPRLRANVDAWRGRVAAEVLDADSGTAIEGYGRDDAVPAMVDGLDEPLRWKGRGDLAGLVGRTVRLRFWLWQAELYAFWFAAAPG